MAERKGFEPLIGTGPITDFESAAFDHSATFPYILSICYSVLPLAIPITGLSAWAFRVARRVHLRPWLGSESAAFDHSATFPYTLSICYSVLPLREIPNRTSYLIT